MERERICRLVFVSQYDYFFRHWDPKDGQPCHVDGNETLLIQEAIKKELRIIAQGLIGFSRGFSRSADDLFISRVYFIVNCHISGNRYTLMVDSSITRVPAISRYNDI